MGISRSGWTEEAIQYQKELQKQKFKGENWQAVGIKLIGLINEHHCLVQLSEFHLPGKYDFEYTL